MSAVNLLPFMTSPSLERFGEVGRRGVWKQGCSCELVKPTWLLVGHSSIHSPEKVSSFSFPAMAILISLSRPLWKQGHLETGAHRVQEASKAAHRPCCWGPASAQGQSSQLEEGMSGRCIINTQEQLTAVPSYP